MKLRDWFDKMEWEGGLDGMATYGIDLPPIKKADPILGAALEAYVKAKEAAEKALEKYDG